MLCGLEQEGGPYSGKRRQQWANRRLGSKNQQTYFQFLRLRHLRRGGQSRLEPRNAHIDLCRLLG